MPSEFGSCSNDTKEPTTAQFRLNSLSLRCVNNIFSYQWLLKDQNVQPAKVGWKSFVIDDPTLTSHETNDELLPSFSLQGRKYITSFDPATGLHIQTYLADDQEEIARKIEKADGAQPSWRETSFTQRKRVVRSLLKWLVDNQDTCAKVACRDTGKTSESPYIEDGQMLIFS